MYKGLAGGYGKIFATGKMTFVIRAQKSSMRGIAVAWSSYGLRLV